MPKALNEKSIRISTKPPQKQGISASFVEGDRQSKVPKPKSLTPKPSYQKKK